MTWLPRRLVWKYRIQRITVGLFSIYLLQRFGCLVWSRCRLALIPMAANNARLGSSTRWLGDRWLLPVSRDARDFPRPCSLADALTRGRLSRLGLAKKSAKANARKLASSTPSADERACRPWHSCATQCSPWRSWRRCRWCPLMLLPKSSVLVLIVLAARLDLSWSLSPEALDDRRSWTSWARWASPGQSHLNAFSGW